MPGGPVTRADLEYRLRRMASVPAAKARPPARVIRALGNHHFHIDFENDHFHNRPHENAFFTFSSSATQPRPPARVRYE